MVQRMAALFPGQGAYFPGALTAARQLPEAGQVLREIDAVAQRSTGETVSDLLFSPDAPAIDELLASNPNLLQLAIYSTSVLAHRVLLSRGLRPDVLVGHSFGEIAALVCAGAFSVADGAEMICHRCAALRSVGELDGYQLALGTDLLRSERILQLIGDPDAVAAVENHEGQTVIAGPRASLDTARTIAGALRIGAVTLKSPYPFHSPMLRDAAFDFAGRIRHIPQYRMEVEVYSPILGRAYRNSDNLVTALAGHLTRRVHFATAVRAVSDTGVGTFVECGSLDALTKITRRVLGDGPSVVPLLLPGASLTETLASLTEDRAGSPTDAPDQVRLALAPGLATAEFERLWTARVDRIARLVISEFSATAEPARTEPPAELPTPTTDFELDRAADPPPAGTALALPAESAEQARAVPARDELFQQLVGIYAEALEYPPEVFDEHADLEAELGVDSVKQTELLRKIGETYRLGPLPADFKIGEHNTLGRIADLISAA
ncbi:acyltransferase domain-containing protein [Nocardia sp. NPDC049149]|uniref:acyltransferase domain-containing protein n=1 Tax=Nocardia sp. NPDC049149 TaxID=3364315 RepID=UPI00371D0FEF